MKNVFLIGYYGFNNFGDDILERIFVNNFKKLPFVARIAVLHTSQSCKDNIDYVLRTDFKTVINTIKSSDVLVFGGGGILQDRTSSKSLYYYLALILLGKLYKKKVLLGFQGIGPFIRPWNALLIRLFLNYLVDYISVRDRDTVLSLRKLRIKRSVSRYIDPSFMFFDEVNAKKPSDKKVLGVTLRLVENKLVKKKYDKVASILNEITRKYNVSIRFLIIHNEKEIPVIEYLKEKLDVEPEVCDVNVDNYDAVKQCTHVLSMRLHLLVLSFMQHIPMLAVSYDSKIANFAKSIHVSCIDYSFKDLEKSLVDLFENPISNSDVYEFVISKKNKVARGFNQINKIIEEL